MIERHNRDPLSRAFAVPFVLQIDKGYAEPAGAGPTPRQPQFVSPLTTAFATRDSMQAVARQSLQLPFLKPLIVHYPVSAASSEGLVNAVYCNPRYVHISLQANPGPAA